MVITQHPPFGKSAALTTERIVMEHLKHLDICDYFVPLFSAVEKLIKYSVM